MLYNISSYPALENCLFGAFKNFSFFLKEKNYYSISPELDCYGSKIRGKFTGICLKQYKITYTHGKIVNIYIVYEISKTYNISSYPALENCLFGAFKNFSFKKKEKFLKAPNKQFSNAG